MSETVSFTVKKVNKLKEDDRFIYLDLYIGLIGLNSNRSFISKNTYNDAKSTIEYIPICATLTNNKKDFLEHEGVKLKCIGVILSLQDNNYRYETIEDEEGQKREYVVVNGVIFKEYNPYESKVLLESITKNTSLEIEVLEKTKKDGLFYFDKFRYQSVVVLGDKYTPGMEGCHLEATSDYKQKYSQDIEKIKYIFSSSNNNIDDYVDKTTLSIDNFTESEVEIVDFDKEKFAQTLGFTANEMWELVTNACSKEKYKMGDYEYIKYYIRDYDDTYIYASDYTDNYRVKAIPYAMDGKECKVDFANVKNSRLRYIVEDDDKENVTFIEEFNHYVKIKIDEKVAEFIQEKDTLQFTFESEKETLKLEFVQKEETIKTEFTTQLEEKQNSIVSFGQELDSLKEQFSTKETEIETFKTENEKLKEDITKFVKEKKESQAELILIKYAKKINEDERKELFSKLEKFNTVEDFEKEVKAFVCDKYEVETKNKKEFTTYSRMGVIITNDVKSDGTHWTDYISDYKNN